LHPLDYRRQQLMPAAAITIIIGKKSGITALLKTTNISLDTIIEDRQPSAVYGL
jgi:hypothetical protein